MRLARRGNPCVWRGASGGRGARCSVVGGGGAECVRRGKTSLRRWRGLRAGERCTRGRGVRGRGVRGIDTHGYRAGGADVKDTLPALAHMGWVGGSAWEDAEGHTLQVNN